jgi:hypothetical protein
MLPRHGCCVAHDDPAAAAVLYACCCQCCWPYHAISDQNHLLLLLLLLPLPLPFAADLAATCQTWLQGVATHCLLLLLLHCHSNGQQELLNAQ